ncbi:MAG: hypothetical protein ACHQ01_09610 [Candidatus Limnocylindrales bacterium]
MPDDLDGLSPEELRAQLAAEREKVSQMEAERLYGRDGDQVRPGGSEGNVGRPRSTNGDDAFVADFAQRFNSKTARHSAMQPVSTAEVQRYVQILAGANLTQAMAETSQHFKRAGISPDVVRKSRERR